MTLKSLNKKFALASVALLAAATLAGAGAGLKQAFAADANGNTQNQVSNGTVKIYAESAAGNTSTSSNNDGSNQDQGITNNQTPAQAGNQGSTHNDGTSQTVSGSTMANVTFAAAKYTGSDTPQQDKNTGVWSGTWASSSDTDNYKTVTTTSEGLADFEKLSDGYWKFSQVTTVNGITTVKDFVVYVNTSDGSAGIVNVYPKLDMSKSAELGDVATTNADDNFSGKTPNKIAATNVTTSDTDKAGSDQTLTNSAANAGNYGNVTTTATDGTATTGSQDGTWANTLGTGGKGGTSDSENVTTAASRDIVNWNVNTVFDSSQTSGAGSTTDALGSYVIEDKLPTDLVDTSKITADTVKVNITDASGKTLTTLPSTDYTVNVATDGTVTVTLSAKGQLDAAAALTTKDANGNPVVNDGGVNLVIPTTVKDGVYGSETDSATADITNAYGAVLQSSDPSSSVYLNAKSTLNVGELDFTKVDNADTSTKLDGATFVLVKAKDKDAAVKYVEANKIYFNNKAGSVEGVAAPAAGTDAEFVTDASGNFVTTTTETTANGAVGVGSFTGLNLVDDNTNTINGPGDKASTNDTGNYFVVEVAAPTGYQLPDASSGANVFGAENATTSLTNGTTDSNTITNTKPFALPFTGGAGIASIIIIAGAAGFAAFAIRRRKNNEEEVTK